MRSIPILVLVIAAIFVSCGKDKFTTKPQLKYKSINTKNISGTQVLTIKLDLTDKEGDFTPLLGVIKLVAGCANDNFIDSMKFFIPQEFINTKGTEGEVVVTLAKNDRGSNSCTIPGGATRPDTTVFKFWTRDKAGNTSDTAVSEQVIILN